MNSNTPDPIMNPNVPPPVPPAALPPVVSALRPTGPDSADDQAPIAGLGGTIQALLRQPRRVMFHLGRPGSGSLCAALFLIAAFCSLVYGLVAGTFSGGDQLWAAPLKVAGGLLLSGLICLPSLYVFACLSGSRASLGEMVGLVAGLLALTAVLLIGFAPVAWVFSQSTQSVAAMGALHLVFALVGIGFGFRFLRHAFARVQVRSGAGVGLWMVVFLFVALQMTTALRPIVGTARTFLPVEKKFFVGHWIDCLSQKSSQDSPAK